MAQFFDELWQWGFAVLTYWEAYASAGLVAGFLYFLEYNGIHVSKRLYLIGAVIFFIVACFLAWRDKHVALKVSLEQVRSLQEEIKKEKEQRLPLLIGKIDQFISGDSPDIASSQLFIIASIRNLGAPSIVEGYTLTVESDSANLEGVPFAIADGFQLLNNENKPIATFSKGEALYEKTIRPIPEGGQVRGWLRFVFKDIKSEKLRQPGNKVVLRFEDVTNKQYKAEWIVTGIQGEIFYYPGTEQPFTKQ